MSKLNALSLSVKLIAGFAAIAAICLALSLYSINQLGTMGGYFNKAYTNAVVPMHEWADYKLAVNDIKSQLNYHVAEMDLNNQEKIQSVLCN